MHWTEDGKIQVTRNFALGTAGGVIVLALVMMLLIGMLISGNGDAEARAEVDPTPSVTAAERETIRPTTKPQNINREDATETLARPLAGTKTEYSTCLVRTQKSLLLDIEDAQFTPWANPESQEESSRIFEKSKEESKEESLRLRETEMTLSVRKAREMTADGREFSLVADVSDLLQQHGDGVYTVLLVASLEGNGEDEKQTISEYSIFHGVRTPGGYGGN